MCTQQSRRQGGTTALPHGHKSVIRRTAALALLALVGISQFAWGAPDPQAMQTWEGVLKAGGASLRLRFEVTKDPEGKFSGRILSVDQGNAVIPISKMAVDGNTIVIEADTASAKFTGKTNEQGTECVGKWTQLNNTFDLTIKRVPSKSELNHVQSWQGTLTAGGREFDFQLRIFVDKQGQQLARLDSFSERKLDVPVKFTFTDDGFEFQLESTKASFSGKYNDDESEINGNWQQGVQAPLTFHKIALKDTRTKLPKPNRPQHPKRPYPYQEHEVSFRNEKADVTLAGTLTIPAGDGPFPAAILITGSGPQDRDETLLDHKPFLVIADHLTRNGIAVLRYDDRGVGKSTGRFRNTTTDDFSRDAECGVDFLKKHVAIEPKRVGIIGHSEGGLIGPMIAARRADVAFVVMMAGPGITGAEISLTQSRAMSKQAGLPTDFLDTTEELLKALIEKAGISDGPLTKNQIDEVARDVAGDSETRRQQIETIKPNVQTFRDPWMVNFLKSDPELHLKKVRCPVLAINGERDLQVLPELNLKAVEKHLKSGGNEDFKTLQLPGLNHLFQTSKTGAMAEYGIIEETFSPVALKAMTDWIVDRMSK